MVATPGAELLPTAKPVRLIGKNGERAPKARAAGHPMPAPEELLAAYRALVVGRRFDRQATSLVKQGRLAVYPSAHGQEAAEVGAVLALRRTDWLFPTYRDSVALVTRGIDPVEVLTLLRGDWHCGYDPAAHRTGPQCTPLATQALHAVGVAYAARARGEDTVVLAFLGDGATSEGDFHEALNFAAVFQVPVVFFVQNNRYAISVPLARQTAAPSLAHKAVGYGVPGVQVDGNDVAAVLAVVGRAAERARAGGGPTLVEAHTYRIEAHTNADDAGRYRSDDEVAAWLDRDPVDRLTAHLRRTGALTDEAVAAVAEEAERVAADLRERLPATTPPAADELFAHVYAAPTPQLREQAARLRAEEH
ncbi:pyruvate dehydrogenase (acetyl-transferring) E1 component subunit alpha [Actinomadura macrotermitis]|uniref:3-methyl-2-oxobutanoate dehydrogenase subunit alpha n=1 Tax=Actinomadura macrotermitis TaxID=2585200 RepID=A0A7K0C6W0_9ACTN|nr:3-methyl-2-oxobutanoate dehydrogenase subunit alpha [Actinomadura macrotermitis]